MSIFGRIPEDGDQVSADGYQYTVLTMDRQRVDRVRVEKLL